MPTATNIPDATRLHVDELILDYLLWFCVESLLSERKLRQEGKVGKREWDDASKSADMGLRLVNCLCPLTVLVVPFFGGFVLATLTNSFGEKHSTKTSTSHIPILFFPTASIYACDCAALRRYFFGVWTSHHLHSRPMPPVPQSEQKHGYCVAVSPTCLHTLLISLAIPLVSPNSAWARLPSQKRVYTEIKKICCNKWGTTHFPCHNVCSGAMRR